MSEDKHNFLVQLDKDLHDQLDLLAKHLNIAKARLVHIALKQFISDKQTQSILEDLLGEYKN